MKIVSRTNRTVRISIAAEKIEFTDEPHGFVDIASTAVDLLVEKKTHESAFSGLIIPTSLQRRNVRQEHDPTLQPCAMWRQRLPGVPLNGQAMSVLPQLTPRSLFPSYTKFRPQGRLILHRFQIPSTCL